MIKIASAELNSQLGIESITDVVRRSKLQWFDHVERKDNDDGVLAYRRFQVS